MITYRDGYKYQLCANYTIRLDVVPLEPVVTEFILLETDGTLTVKRGYAWDGPSGPTIDTKTFMRGSLIHDALYQLLREKYLPIEARAAADKALHRACREDGMNPVRAWAAYLAVRWFGRPGADPVEVKHALTAT